ncbi:MAG TPA: UpxY family transcription antiterminator [Candidatus Acidoferrales bacterium]|nr:UpxY family transcription antiterminator [Candidatus Acidoferrales bacterium]
MLLNPRMTSDGASDQAWYALYTRHQHEKCVAAALLGRGHEIFLPLYSAVHRWKDRTKQLHLPLFPSYVFIQSSLDRRMEILSVPGVFGFAGSPSRPSIVPEAEIEGIRRAMHNNLFIEPHPFLDCGDRVRVVYGPLQDVEGILIRKRNQFRLVLSVEMLGRAAAVEVDATAVVRVSRRKVFASPLTPKGLAAPADPA